MTSSPMGSSSPMGPGPGSASAVHAVHDTAPRRERSWREQRGKWLVGSAVGMGSGWVSAVVVAAALGATPALADSCNSGNVADGNLLSSANCQASASGANATAVGDGATANGDNASALGASSNAQGVRAI